MSQEKRYAFSVKVETAFVAEQSDVEQNRYVFSYTMHIENTGNVAAQLISRHWIITDATGKVQEVRGLGVIGQQPLLQPGERFQYSSGTILATPVGEMRGYYHITAEDGTQFDSEVSPFQLNMPRVLH